MGCVESVPVQQAHYRTNRPTGGRVQEGKRVTPQQHKKPVKKTTPTKQRQQASPTKKSKKHRKDQQEVAKRIQQQKRNPQFSQKKASLVNQKKQAALDQKLKSTATETRKRSATDAAVAQEKKERGIPPPPPTNALDRDINEYKKREATFQNENVATTHEQDPEEFRKQVEALIPSEVIMISGCEDEQTSADVANAGNRLPDPKGRAGGAATSTLLQLLYEHKGEQFTFQDTLMALRDKLQVDGMSQIPQMTSSRPLDIDEREFGFASGEGERRAVLVGINYRGQNGELRGCHNDVYHMRDYLVKEQGFPEANITVLTDDGMGLQPTKQKMITALKDMADISKEGDSVFFHYSGHGGFLEADQNSLKQKNDEYDQTLIPLDHRHAGQIRDFNLFNHFVRPMKKGVSVTCLMDCCHSGSVLDLPYSYKPTAEGKGSAYGQRMSIGSLAGSVFLALLAGVVLDDLIFGPCFGYYDMMGLDYMMYEGMYEDILVNDLLIDGLIEDEIEREVEARVEEEVEREIEDEIEREIESEVEAELTRELEQEIEREVEAEIQREIEADIQREIEAELQREVERELERELQREMEREMENAFMDNMDDMFMDV
ncbi:MAG: hypothetical protein SGILL_007082 [Bacillariaceae sp.]